MHIAKGDFSFFDVAVIGGGPAGLGAAHALRRYGMSCVVIEKSPNFGGLQFLSPYGNSFLAGWKSSLARDIAHKIMEDALEVGAIISANTNTSDIIYNNDMFDVLTNKTNVHAKAIVLATGSHCRGEDWIIQTNGAEEIRESIKIGPFNIGAHIQNGVNDQRILVIGGGDNAFDSARIAAQDGAKSTVLTRGRITANDFVLSAARNSGVFEENGSVLNIRQKEYGFSVDKNNGKTEEYDYIYICFGYQPTSKDFLSFRFTKDCDFVDEGGYVKRDLWSLETPIRNVWAIGEVTKMRNPCVQACLGEAIIAARVIEERFRGIC